jgi:hypothetical protein
VRLYWAVMGSRLEHWNRVRLFAASGLLGSTVLLAGACGSEEAGRNEGASGSAGISGAGGFDAGSVPDTGAQEDGAAGADADSAPPNWPPPRRATTLPLEVIGAPGVGVEASLVLDATDVERAKSAGSASLFLTLHNVVEPTSTEVSVNDGTPADLGARGGPFLRSFDGQVASGRIALDPDELATGTNRIVFRYTRQVMDRAAVSGFRVLAVRLELPDRTVALDLPADDPAAWRPLDSSAAALERGRRFFQDESRDGGPACARCHADSGADLQYYAFSTHSIVERAMFHEFPRSEAEDIASYIRSLPTATAGHPYDAPFQPGAGNHGAAGSGYGAILPNDEAFAEASFGGLGLPESVAWDWPASADTFRVATRAEAPTWMRWLPRQLSEDWFTRKDGVLATAEQALRDTPSLQTAQTFMSAALTVGKDVLLTDGDYAGKVDVLRFAAVKLWDWSRKNGFDRPDHGLPDGSPAYPYEVGFAFFEAAQADALPGAAKQTIDWWWAQLAANPGRGVSTGRRPLNFEDVLSAAENAALGPSHIAFLHLYGSWEESRGALASRWGTADSPVRLLLVPMRTLPAADRVSVLRRFLIEEAEHLARGGTLDDEHRLKLAAAWAVGCQGLATAELAELRSLAPGAVRADLAACA